ncbi:hypothetical protein KDA_66250 [Dictyobacter alpinus]|uniref:Uncharacterized protein n=1 Tax=Dictyobacter alpinus TaxID=2014873 RepID=A0A402BI95_9CHLR|nr:hypothetical protein [Dictyobacter alpinus]GCE31141.1 hypothetical protein KDA_66250 [Dictyobacter alpinus]
MAHLRFMNPANSQITGSIKRAQQLIRSQYIYLEDHPQFAPKNFRHLRNLALRLEKLSRTDPRNVNEVELNSILKELSSIVDNLQHAA